MTGLGEEVITRCPTCGYGLTARRYAVPKECPLCHGSFDAEVAPAPQLSSAHESEKEAVVVSEVKGAVAGETVEDDERGQSRVTLSVTPGVETGPLGLTTQRITESGPEEATREPEARSREASAPDEPLEAGVVEPQPTQREPAIRQEEPGAQPYEASVHAPRYGQEPPQGLRIEHATPAASAHVEAKAFAPPTTKIDTFSPPPVSSSQPPMSSSQLMPQPAARTAHVRGSLEERVSPEVVGRYSDAYRVARATVFVGNLIKVFGVLLGLLVGGSLFALVATQGRLLGGTGAVGFFAGLLVGGCTFAFFFVLGVAVSAQGQLIKATLDSAVNNSPFLTNEERAEAMSLR